MVTRNADSSQGDGGSTSPPRGSAADMLRSRSGNIVFKSGHLFISSKGIGWTSWKKRWFILTRTSLVFFRSDPNIVTQKSGEVNLTLGGIDLNNSGSVVVKADKKLLTVLFPDGRDGRNFTLKAETSEDLYEWKNALETALAQAPSAALVMGQNGIFRNDAADPVDGTLEQCRGKQPLNSLVLGRPILLALEDIDGSPSFLEKALRFLEQYGVKEEGILRQAADVDDVERRVREYEEGKNEFSPEEDAHVIADCVKHVLRELPSSPVPASCCNALLEAYRSDRGVRINAMRAAIAETFPEPNCRLLQRILKMMQSVASHKAENRMSLPAVAACMAPLLLRPLLAGDCELGNNFKMDGDCVQLLQAAAAANHAQAIIITLLDEYNNIFGVQDGSYSPELYSDSEESGSEDEEASDDDDCNYSQQHLDADTEDDIEHDSMETCSESSGNEGSNLTDDEVSEGSDSGYESSAVSEDSDANQESPSVPQTSVPGDASVQSNNNLRGEENTSSAVHGTESCETMGDIAASMVGDIPASTTALHKATGCDRSSSSSNSTNKQNGPEPCAKRRTVLGRTSAMKNLSMESIDHPSEDEAEILRLEVSKIDLQNRIAKEEKGNVILQASLVRQKEALHDRRLALEQDVARLHEQLQREIDLREALEAGLGMSPWHLPVSASIDCKTKADLEEIAVAEADIINLDIKVADLHMLLDKQRQENHGSVKDSHSQQQQTPDHQAMLKDHQQKPIETTEPERPHERTKNTSLDGVGSVNVRTPEHQSSSNKKTPHEKLLDSVSDNIIKSVGVSATSSAVLPVVVEPGASSNSKKSGTKDEGTVSTSSALTKLTTRLNFLKERRNQIVNELQNLDKGGRSEGQSVGASRKINSR